MYSYYNPNPRGKLVGDCVIRAISKVTGQDWEQTYAQLAAEGYAMCDMPSSNNVFGRFLKNHGFVKKIIPEDEEITVEEFCQIHPHGTYAVVLHNHIVAIIDGVLYDSWDSRNEIPEYYWEKRS